MFDSAGLVGLTKHWNDYARNSFDYVENLFDYVGNLFDYVGKSFDYVRRMGAAMSFSRVAAAMS